MKKLIFVLAIALMASPVLALNVYLQREGTTNVVDVMYSGADANNLPRGIALDISSPTGTTITLTAGSYYQGESTSANPKFGIYPARIVIDSAGAVSNYGSPLADVNDPGAGADGTKHVVLEFGSLYVGDTNKPATSGTLCKFNFSAGAVSNPTIVMVDEDTYRGGLVLEDGTLGEVDTSLVFTTAVIVGAPTYTNPATDGATGIARAGINLTWTAGANATSHDVYFGTVTPPPFKQNQAGLSYATGAMTQGVLYYWKIVEKNGTDSNSGPTWSFRVEECLKNTPTAIYNDWVLWGRPSCWCYQRQCKGDWNGSKVGVQWVQAVDLNALVSAYGKNLTQLGQITNGICADFNHSKVGVQRVQAVDLNTLVSWYGKNSTVVTICPSSTVNFWTN